MVLWGVEYSDISVQYDAMGCGVLIRYLGTHGAMGCGTEGGEGRREVGRLMAAHVREQLFFTDELAGT
eukprot:2616123-Rhodomonas_salina.2